ncbi:MAG: PKD domain-containing protein, partial [Thermoplasmata archaeon]|nr:PKD domain-containing protein [Thermoplasmata archaeon]
SVASADVGQKVTFSVVADHGSGTYSYSWTGLPAGCSPPSGLPAATCTVSAAGPFSVQVVITDAYNETATSGVLPFMSYADPTVTIVTNRTAFDEGQSASLTAVPALGSGGYVLVWSGLPSNCAAAGAVIDCTPASAGNFSVHVKVTDSNGVAVSSGVVLLEVASPLAATLASTSSSPTTGESVTFTATISGGTGPVNVTWRFGDGTSGTGVAVNHAYGSTGTFELRVWVNDSSGGSVQASLNVTVSKGASPIFGASSNAGEYELLGVGLIVIVVGCALALWWVRGRKGDDATADRPAEPESGDSSPEPLPTEAEASPTSEEGSPGMGDEFGNPPGDLGT